LKDFNAYYYFYVAKLIYYLFSVHYVAVCGFDMPYSLLPHSFIGKNLLQLCLARTAVAVAKGLQMIILLTIKS